MRAPQWLLLDPHGGVLASGLKWSRASCLDFIAEVTGVARLRPVPRRREGTRGGALLRGSSSVGGGEGRWVVAQWWLAAVEAAQARDRALGRQLAFRFTGGGLMIATERDVIGTLHGSFTLEQLYALVDGTTAAHRQGGEVSSAARATPGGGADCVASCSR